MAKTQQQSTSKASNLLLWLIALFILAAAIAGNWYFGKQYSAPIRAVGVIIMVIVALVFWLKTNFGRAAWKLAGDARVEMRKVVWPTRQETLQSTLMVIAIVAIVALILWGVDSLFALIMSRVIF